MVLPLAYIADNDGKPVPWNESRWVDEEFSKLLKTAQGTLDVEARRALMKDFERIQQERGSVAIAWWQSVWNIKSPSCKAHPPTRPTTRSGARPGWTRMPSKN